MLTGIAMGLWLLGTGTPPVYFPNDSLSPHSHEDAARSAEWYGGVLASLGEAPLPGLSGAPGTTYRFTFMPAFSRPTMVRIDHLASGETRLTTKELPEKHSPPGTPARTSTRTLTTDEWRTVERLVESASFWTQPPDLFDMGLDGAQYLVEGAGAGSYRSVHRWSPDDGTFMQLCDGLSALAGWGPAAAVPVVDPRSPGMGPRAILTGAVTDAPTRAPLAGVTVRLEGAGVTETRSTDAQGRFALPAMLPGLYRIRFQRFDGDGRPFELGLGYSWGQPASYVRLAPGAKNCLHAALPRPPANLDQPPPPAVLRVGCAEPGARSLPPEDGATPARHPQP